MSAVLQPRPALGHPQAWDYPRFEQHHTDHGLAVWLRHLPSQPRLALQVLIDASVLVEDPAQRGVANLVTMSLDEGTPTLDATGFADALDRTGATFSAGVDAAATFVAARFPAWRFEDALGLVADAILHPVFPEAEIERLVNQRLDSIRRELITPESRAVREFRRHGVAGDHRLTWPTAGDRDTVARLGRADALAFHRDMFVPRGLAVVLAGDLSDLDPVATIGDALAGLTPAPQRPPAPLLRGRPGPRTIVVDRPGAVQTALRIGRVGPDRSSPDWPALRLASHVLGGSITGRLNTVLREQKGYTYGVNSLLSSQRAGGFVVATAGSVHTEHTAAALRDALDIVADIATVGPTGAELEAARDALIGVQPLRTESVANLATQVAHCLAEDLPHDHVAAVLEQVRDVTASEVVAAAATHLRPDDMTVIAVGDAASIASDLEAVGYGTFDVIRDSEDAE